MAVSLLARKMLASLCLRVLHFCYYLAVSLSNFWKTFDLRKPQHLTAERTKLPSHLALLLVVGEDIDAEEIEDSLVECVLRGVTWCQAVGIRQLTVYDSQGAYRIVAILPIVLDIYQAPCSIVLKIFGCVSAPTSRPAKTTPSQKWSIH